MDPIAAAQYGMGAFALAILAYALLTLVVKRNGSGDVKRVLDRLAEAQERLAAAMERQTLMLEQQSRMLERLSERVDAIWREVDRA